MRKRPGMKVNFSYTELLKRIGFTFSILMIYRLCTHIPIPGLNPAALKILVEKSSGGFISMLNLLSGGSIERATIMMLGITSYITASIMLQVYTPMSPTLQAWKKDGETGQKKRNQWTRYLALVITVIQSMGIAYMLETRGTQGGIAAVMLPGWIFRFTTVISITAGTFFLIWLSEQITDRGIGQGSSVVIYTNIVASLPANLYLVKRMFSQGFVTRNTIIFDIVLILALMLLASYIEQVTRSVKIIYPGGAQHLMQQKQMSMPNVLPVKFNVGGVMAPIAAQSFVSLPKQLSYIIPSASQFILSNTFYFIVTGFLIFALSFVTSVISLDPEETADNLQRDNCFVEGVKIGKPTQKFFEDLLNRLACFSGIYLVIMCLIPDIYIKHSGLQIHLGGTSLLIIIGTTYEMIAQITSYTISMQYDKLFSKYTKF